MDEEASDHFNRISKAPERTMHTHMHVHARMYARFKDTKKKKIVILVIII